MRTETLMLQAFIDYALEGLEIIAKAWIEFIRELPRLFKRK
jgi:hypothetical protein